MENRRSRHHHLRPIAAVTGGAGGGREDCWSEGATEILVKAWGDRYVELNRGNLRQNDWREVADAVNGREKGSKPRKTDAQCKNRIDTLKKKFKLEKTKPPPSKWPLYDRLDYLIGSGAGVGKKTPPARPSQTNLRSTTFKINPCKGQPNPNPNPNGSLPSPDSDESSHGEDDEDAAYPNPRVFSDQAALGRAILKLGETYERVESLKQKRMMELEKERLEFAKDLEFQRMRMFMEAQLELAKIKRPKHVLASGIRNEMGELESAIGETQLLESDGDYWDVRAQLPDDWMSDP